MIKESRNKKILLVCHGIGHGGAQRVTTILANQLDLRGYIIKIVTTAPSPDIYPINSSINYYPIIATQNGSIRRNLFRLFEIKKNIIEFNPDYILSLSAIPNMLTILAKGFKKIPVVVSERTDPGKHPDNIILQKIRNILYMIPCKIVFQTNEAKAWFPSSIRDKGIVIPNAIMPNIPEVYTGEREKKIVGFGSLSVQKNWMVTIKAFELFSQEHKEYKLIIYGEGDEREKLENYIKTRPFLKEKIEMPGYRNEIHNIIKNASLFVSSSDYDGISNSILESMALGLPCVCTDAPIGGAKMLINSGENGLLVPVGDYMEMYKAMKKMIECPEFATKCAYNATKVRERFKIDKIIDQWENCIISEE